MARPTPGLRERHGRACPAPEGGGCTCRPGPTIEAWAYDPKAVYKKRDGTPARGKKIRKQFTGPGALTAAKKWRAEATTAVNNGTLKAPSRVTLREAADAWLKGAKAGEIRTRSGQPYKPAALRGYEQALRDRVLPDLGGAKLAAIRRADVQDLADRLVAEGHSPSTVRNALLPLRAIYRRAAGPRGDVAVNPTTGLELPAVTGSRDRIASPTEAEELLTALPEADRALWATAFYAGLRRGELRGLKWEAVDLAAGEIRVEQGYDDKEGAIETKSQAGVRTVPIVGALRAYLVEHRLRSGRATGYLFTGRDRGPFTPSAVRRRADTAWRAANKKRLENKVAPLTPIGLHECRHTFASLLIAAGVNVKAISSYMGHSSITITLDRYGHLMPGHAAEAVERIDAYLASATGAQSGAQAAGGA
jgi:integrase